MDEVHLPSTDARYRVGYIFAGSDDPVFMFFGLPHETAIAAKQAFQKYCPRPYREIVMEPDENSDSG